MLRKVGEIYFHIYVLLIYSREWRQDCSERFPELCSFLAPNQHSGRCCGSVPEALSPSSGCSALTEPGAATPRGRGSQLHPGASVSLLPAIDRGIKTVMELKYAPLSFFFSFLCILFFFFNDLDLESHF